MTENNSNINETINFDFKGSKKLESGHLNMMSLDQRVSTANHFHQRYKSEGFNQMNAREFLKSKLIKKNKES